MSFENRITNNFDNITDLHGRKEERDGLLFEAIKNSMSNPYGDTQLYGVILMVEAQGIVGPDGSTLPRTKNPTHPFVVSARIRPLAPAAEAQNLEEPCKYKNDPSALYECLMQHPIGYSESLDGDEDSLIPTVGDVVPIYYDIEGPTSSGKKRGLRFKMRRVRRAEGGFDQTCLEALGAKMTNGQISLSAIGNPGGVIVSGGGGGIIGTGTAIGPGGTSGIGATPGTLAPELLALWPSGIVGVKKGEEGNIKEPSKNAWGNAMKQRDWWMNTGNNPLWAEKKVPYGINYKNADRGPALMRRPNLLTILDGTMKYKEKNLWTYDITDRNNPKLLVYTWGGIGFSSFGAGQPAGMRGGNSKGVPLDFANGNSHTSAGMKVFGFFRGYHSGTRPKPAIHIWGLHPWNGNEERRGAIGHETALASARSRSAGCISTPREVHYSAYYVWKGGSWCYVWTGQTDESNANNIFWRNMSGAKYHVYEKRKTWSWSQPYGGHTPVTVKPPRPKKKKKRKKKKSKK